MKFIGEEIIERVIQQFEDNDKLFDEKIEEITKKQPALLAYIISDNFKILTDAEKEFLLYTMTVIVTSAMEGTDELPLTDQDRIGEIEELNWEVFQTQAGTFRERLDLFFEDYEQEDLLAFVEDSLSVEDEEAEAEVITKVGRDVIFVALRTVIDVLG